MLYVFGNEYKFLDNEVKLLKQIFDDIKYIDEISSIEKSKNIFINIPISKLDTISDDLLKRQNILTLKKFLPKYLKKCYVSYDESQNKYLESIHTYTLSQKIQKKAIDLFGLFWLFLFSSPVMLWCIYKIKKQSPGNVIFTQPRVGLNNKSFKCYKFRTMHENSRYDPYTHKEDERIFAWGKVMRKARFDELPQMLNILKGEMHLIGPRAEWDILVDKYVKIIPNYSQRHLIAPGITGWAQVNYPYGENEEDARQKLMYDLYYIKYWSLKLEFLIVHKTMMTVINKQGI